MGWDHTLTLYCDTDLCDAALTFDADDHNRNDIKQIARQMGWRFTRHGYATCEECNYTGQDLVEEIVVPLNPDGTVKDFDKIAEEILRDYGYHGIDPPEGEADAKSNPS